MPVEDQEKGQEGFCFCFFVFFSLYNLSYFLNFFIGNLYYIFFNKALNKVLRSLTEWISFISFQ